MATVIPGHCIMLDGHGATRDEALAAARVELETRGWDELDIDEALAARGVVRRAWWGGDQVGFVQEHHDGAAPVTVVNVAVTS